MDFFSKSKMTAWLIIILFLLNIATLIFMWGTLLGNPKPPFPPPDFRPEKKDMMFMLKEELKMNSAQTFKLQELSEIHRKNMEPVGDSILIFKKNIVEETFKENPDLNKIKVYADKIGFLQSHIELNISNHFINLIKICNNDQKEKFRKLILEPLQHPPGLEPPMRGKNNYYERKHK